MSPEQARGKPVDQRTDVWAMGVCLFEALAKQKPFAGDTVTDILAAVVNGEPHWESLPPQTPTHIRRLLHRSLTKNARRRIHHAADARLELEATTDDVAPTTKPKRLPLLAVVVDVDTTREFSHGTPKTLIDSEGYFIGVMPKGDSFVTVDTPEVTSESLRNLVLVQNWTEELKRLVPSR